MNTNTQIKKSILKQTQSFTHDLACVTYLLFSETMHLLRAQAGRAGRREAFKITMPGQVLSCDAVAQVPVQQCFPLINHSAVRVIPPDRHSDLSLTE